MRKLCGKAILDRCALFIAKLVSMDDYISKQVDKILEDK